MSVIGGGELPLVHGCSVVAATPKAYEEFKEINDIFNEQ
jgi:hypothetical protein